MKYKYLFGCLLFFSGLCFYFFHLIYTDALEAAISELNSRQIIHAKQSQKGIEDFFRNLISFQTKISESSHIIYLDDQGRKAMDFSLNFSPEFVTAITRVNEFGKITYTSPYNEEVIGRDIVGQKHIQKIMQNHKPVVSDVFIAVQGYAAVALHVPVFKDNVYRGTLGVLVDFSAISKRFLQEIKVGETGYAWMTSREGIELYCPVPGHTGKSVFENCKDFPTIISMAEEMVKGRQGVTTYIFDRIKGQQTKSIKKHAVYMPVKILDNFWTIVVASSEDEVLSSLVRFKNKIMIIAALLLLGSVLFSYYGMKAWGIVREREERQKAEEELKSQQDFIKNALDAQNDTFFVFDPESGKALHWNKAFSEISGYSDEEIEKQLAPNTYYSPDDLLLAQEYVKRIFDGGSGTVLLDLICKNGKRISTEYSASVLRGKKGSPNLIIAIGRDITERREMETRLKQVHKMEAIGTMAGGIAHDFNNILAVTIGNADLALYGIPEENPARNNIEQILKASYRATDLVKQILAFTRQTDQKTKPLNIIQATEDSIKLLRSTIPTSVEILMKFGLDDGFIMADPTQYHQLMINLCTNAAQAMHDKGVLEVSLQEVNLTNKELLNQQDKLAGQYIKLSVSDIGEGMNKATIDRIFDPFFTSKEVGKGTGMGLSVVHGIVESHGGFITVESEEGKGSTFHVLFPKTEGVATVETKVAEVLPTGNEKILFVDDEIALTEMGCKMLEHLGYSVTTLTSSSEALEIFRSQQNSFDLIITDMAMPELTGKELTAEILKLKSDIPIILCTGYSSLISKEDAKEIGIREFCMKPLDMKQLAKTVRKVLDENAK